MFREGGEGYILKTPTYWLRGTVDAIYRRPHRMALCPQMGKPREALHARRLDAGRRRLPLRHHCPAKEREVEAIRIACVPTPGTRLDVTARTQWLALSRPFPQHRTQGGCHLDIDGTLLERCEPRE